MIDIEKEIASYLSKNLNISVSGDVPKEMPQEFVSFEMTSSQTGNIVLEYATVVIQCWAQTRVRAKEIALLVDGVVKRMPDDYFNITSAERNSLYNFPDPQSKKARYQLVVDFVIQQ